MAEFEEQKSCSWWWILNANNFVYEEWLEENLQKAEADSIFLKTGFFTYQLVGFWQANELLTFSSSPIKWLLEKGPYQLLHPSGRARKRGYAKKSLRQGLQML